VILDITNMRIKIDKADQEFSYFIRLRDKECRRCGSKVTLNAKGMPNSHHASHYFGRGKESTRFDVENVDTLCFGCHQEWGSKDREGYRVFKLRQLGKTRFDLLTIQANSYKKRDRAMELIIIKEMLKHV